MTKKCNNCQHSWTTVVYSCSRCGSSDMTYSEDLLPTGYKAPEVKIIGEDLKAWYKASQAFIKKNPRKE